MAKKYKFDLKQLVLWKLRTIRSVIMGRYNYVLLTPPFFNKQWVFRKKDKKIFSVFVRDEIDYFTLQQIYLQEDYAIGRLAHADKLRNFYKKALAAGMTPLIIDCGANIGLSAKYFSQSYPEASIVAVEPEDGNMAQAKSNCADAKNVSLIKAAIASSNTKGKLFDPKLGNNAFRVSVEDDGNLELVSINSMLENAVNNKVVPFIVKIDIEGFEKNLFSENTEWIDKFPLLIIELHDWMLPGQGISRNFLRQISTLDRDFVHIGENVYSISNRDHLLFMNKP